MQEKNSVNIEEKLYDRIIAVAYNDASLVDRFVVYRMARKNPGIQNILNEFKATATAVHRPTGLVPDALWQSFSTTAPPGVSASAERAQRVETVDRVAVRATGSHSANFRMRWSRESSDSETAIAIPCDKCHI